MGIGMGAGGSAELTGKEAMCGPTGFPGWRKGGEDMGDGICVEMGIDIFLLAGGMTDVGHGADKVFL